MKFIVNEQIELREFLYKNIHKSKNSIKTILKDNTYINGKKISKYNYLLKNNDIVEIREKIEDLDIIYEDKNIIVINKKEGLLTVGTEKEKEKTAYHMVSEYLKKKNKNNKTFVIHRLDKETSGIVMFAKNEKIKHLYQEKWNDLVKLRNYIAIVEGKTKEKGVIKSNLNENKFQMVSSSKNGKLAITEYKKIKSNEKYTLLNVVIKTGRKNQIRVHMKEMENVIVGDKKYGSKENPINRLCLVANKLELINPLTNKIMRFEIDIPNSLKKVIK